MAARIRRLCGTSPICGASRGQCVLSFMPGRSYTTGADDAQVVFNNVKKDIQRSVSARASNSAEYDYIRDEIAARLVDRLNDITRAFPVALDLGANTCNVAKQLEETGAGAVKRLYVMNRNLSEIVPLPWAPKPNSGPGDDAPSIPLPDASVDLVVSSSNLHWVNNVPGTLREALRVLRPDGVFLAAFLGGETLAELRSAFVAAESERDGGVSPRVSPMMGVADAGNLLSAAGFGIPTVDSDVFACEYPSALHLMEHLQGMGESGAALLARPGGRRSTLLATAATYQALYGNPEDGSVRASFEIVYMIGWKPAPSQPLPLKRGSVAKGFAARTKDKWETVTAGELEAGAGDQGSAPAGDGHACGSHGKGTRGDGELR